MTEQYRVAIAGCHRMLDRQPASHNWASAFDAVADCDMVAVFDRGAETRRAFQDCWGPGIVDYDDFGRMLEQERPDILCVATRQTLHAGHIQQAVAAGVKGILCDKPLATSLAEADGILDRCRAAGVPLALGLDRRWWDSYRHLAVLIAHGIVGRVESIIAYAIPNLINHGCHWYDTVLLMVGDPEPKWVSGLLDDLSGDDSDSRRHLDPPGRGQVGLDRDMVLYCTPDGGRLPAFDIIGDEGRLSIQDDARQVLLWPTALSGWEPVDMPDMQGSWPSGPAIVRDLCHAIGAGTRTACDVEEARRATEIGFAFHLSHAQQGARIWLPAADRNLRIPSFLWGNE